jgi:hypothetical protein
MSTQTRASIFFLGAIVAFVLLFPMETLGIDVQGSGKGFTRRGGGNTIIGNAPAPPPIPLIEITLPEVTATAIPDIYQPALSETGLRDQNQFQNHLRYCYVGDGWGNAEIQGIEQGIGAWQGVGVTFTEVNNLAVCDLQISLYHDSTSAYGGWGTLGPGFGPSLPARVRMNTFYGISPLGVAHEIGHVLGLVHASYGVMAPSPQSWPSPNEFAQVRAIWGITQ